MLPFFAVKLNIGPLSGEQAQKSMKRQGIAKADIYNGICRYFENKTRRIYLMPCITYFNSVFELCKGQKVAFGFW